MRVSHTGSVVGDRVPGGQRPLSGKQQASAVRQEVKLKPALAHEAYRKRIAAWRMENWGDRPIPDQGRTLAVRPAPGVRGGERGRHPAPPPGRPHGRSRQGDGRIRRGAARL